MAVPLFVKADGTYNSALKGYEVPTVIYSRRSKIISKIQDVFWNADRYSVDFYTMNQSRHFCK